MRHRAWIKHITYFIVTSIVFFSIGINPVAFRIIAFLIVIAGFLELFSLFRESGFAGKIFFSITIVTMVLLSLGFILFSMEEKGLVLFAFLILSIFDGFSQVSGQLLGKTKLFPKISPNKTVEGLIGGSLVAILSSLVFKNLVPVTSLKAICLAGIIVVFAFAGDALKSLYKRNYNVKDFSNLIPGHGGVLDRFDSLIAGGAGVSLLGLLMTF
ncbi:phosphatidate cytidylyltransferase [bacterium]|nr:phosphatidate cytidylyltransferase [bacterium]